MTIDITPEAVERLISRHSNLIHPSTTATLRALSAALTDYQKGQTYRYLGKNGLPILARDLEDQCDAAIAALAAAEINIKLKADFIEKTINDSAALYHENCDLKSALAASQAETAASYGVAAQICDREWAAEQRSIATSMYPTRANCDYIADELRLSTPSDSKATLDRMIAEAEERGLRKAAALARQSLVDGAFIKRGSHQETPSSVMFLAETLVSNSILAAIPKGKNHE